MGVQDIRLPPKWIELNLNKRECFVFIPSENDEVICQCGRRKLDHGDYVHIGSHHHETWSPAQHTEVLPTDAYGTILFEGEHHPNKAHYVRLSYDTHPELVIQLLTLVWGIQMPKLVISIKGGNQNFELPARLGKILQTGLTKAAKSTSAWILTSGVNRGVTKHIGNVFCMGYKRGRTVSIGIAPWGLIEHRQELVGRNRDKIYNPLEHVSSNLVLLNSRHSNFLLVDNGSVGKFGGDSYFRRRLEKCIASYPTSPHRGCNTPIVVIIIEGGMYTLRSIGDCLHDEPPVPVVIFAGTGRTADLVAMAIKKSESEDIDSFKDDFYSWMIRVYKVHHSQCSVLFSELKRILSRRNLVTVYVPHATNDEEFDAVILASIFRSQHWSPLQQLSLALVWDRVDIASNEVFVYGREWSRDHLEHAMMEALMSNRLDFVHLLLEHGLNMQSFLTPTRLEALYTSDKSHSQLMKNLTYELGKIRAAYTRNQGSLNVYERNLTLHDIGLALSHMMGHVYKSNYVHISTKLGTRSKDAFGLQLEDSPSPTFTQPFDDLFVWAVLTQRHDMALLLWRHGQGALAKALVAVKLNKYLAKELSSTETTQTNISNEFLGYASTWENLSVELLDSCFRMDSKQARKLLTMELEHWSNQTCLTLAVMANHRMLMGHACSQILLADLWMGALNIKSNSTLNVILGIFLPPFIFCCEYKTTEELQLLPHQEKEKKESAQEAKTSTPSLVTFAPKSSIYQIENRTTSELERKIPTKKNRERKTDLEKVANSLISPQNQNKYKYQAKENKNEKSDDLGKEETDNDSTKVNINDEEEGVYPSMNHLIDEDLKPQKYIPKREKINQSSYVTNRQFLSPWSKFCEFQRAPITNFYRHFIAYIVFVSCLSYVILVPQDKNQPGHVELYVIAYLATYGMDTLREFFSVDAIDVTQKWIEFRENIWQLADFTVILFFMVGVGLRYNHFPEYGFLLYKLSSLYWNLRLYKYMGVHRFVGPKIVMMSRMIKHMFYFAMIILVVIIAFGIARESIRFPDAVPTWRNIAEAFLEPYVMMFGEVDIDAVSPQCGEDGQRPCPEGHWIIPLIWAVYMMVANILIVNVLIAVFNGIYYEVEAIAVELWMFQRFTFVMEFEQKPLLPPPFITICHACSILKCLWKKCLMCMCEQALEVKGMDYDDGPRIIMGDDHSLKTFLTSAEAHAIFDFEEDNLDTLVASDDSSRKTQSYMEARISAMGPEGSRLDGRGLNNIKANLKELHEQMENQRSKLDRLISYWEANNEYPLVEDNLSIAAVHDPREAISSTNSRIIASRTAETTSYHRLENQTQPHNHKN